MAEQIRVFISHHHSLEEDRFTARLKADLQAGGADVWVDDERITSDDFIKKINEGMAGRQWLVLVMTPDSLRSPWVQREVNAALNLTGQGSMRGVIPVVAKPCNPKEIPALWATLHRYDATRDYQAALFGLLHALGLPLPVPPQPDVRPSPRPVPPMSPARTPVWGLSRRALLIGGIASVAAFGTAATVFSAEVIGKGLHNPPTQTPVDTPFIYNAHKDYVTGLTWSPDSKRIASCSNDGTVQVWDASNGGHAFTYRGHKGFVEAVGWSPNGKRILSGGGVNDGTVQVWNASDGGNVFTYRGHKAPLLINAAAWSPDGTRIASAGADKTIQIWNASDGSNVLTYTEYDFPSSNAATDLTWSPDGKRICSIPDLGNKATVWNTLNLGDDFVYEGYPDIAYRVKWSPDGRHIVICGADDTARVWNAGDGTDLFTYRGHASYVYAVAWSPDSKRIASCGNDNTVQVWDATNGTHEFTYRGHSAGVLAVEWSPNGKLIASGGRDYTAQVWPAP